MSALLLDAPQNQKFLADVSKYLLQLEGCLKQEPFFASARANGSMPARDSGEFFIQCIEAMENAFAPHLNAYSTMRWMYYLRRMPNKVFRGDLASTAPNARALIEVYANRSSKLESATHGSRGFVFPVNESTLRHIARFVAFIIIIYDLHVGFRLSSKGFDFSFASAASPKPGKWPIKGPLTHTPMASPAPTILPQRVADPVLASAVEIYDQRHDAHKHTFLSAVMSRVGLARDNITETDTKPSLDVSRAYWGLLGKEVAVSPQPFLEGHPYAAHYGNDGKILARFAPSNLELERIFELYRLPAMAAVGIDPDTSMCLIVLLLGGRWLQASRYSILRALELGYFIANLEAWRRFGERQYEAVCAEIHEVLPQFEAPDNFEAFSAVCMTSKGEVWPTAHGAPAKATNDYMCIDMWAASMGFLASFQFPKLQGNIANTRAAKFEDVVQEAVDRTRWGNAEHRGLRQRPLRINGQDLTDIDAIGSYDRTLLLISCKSIPYTREYDQGTHNSIRNAASTVDRGVELWVRIVGQLSANRTGDNFDFSGYNRIVGVVCTPFAVYTSNAQSLSIAVEDLRWACSLEELIEFLEGSQ